MFVASYDSINKLNNIDYNVAIDTDSNLDENTIEERYKYMEKWVIKIGIYENIIDRNILAYSMQNSKKESE